jgi:hypothetical protein
VLEVGVLGSDWSSWHTTADVSLPGGVLLGVVGDDAAASLRWSTATYNRINTTVTKAKMPSHHFRKEATKANKLSEQPEGATTRQRITQRLTGVT